MAITNSLHWRQGPEKGFSREVQAKIPSESAGPVLNKGG
jgi:hypothetical protein